jgi:predicted transcriptional regulator
LTGNQHCGNVEITCNHLICPDQIGTSSPKRRRGLRDTADKSARYKTMLNDHLKNLGLTDKEISVYLEVLKNGRVSPAAVSRTTKINRTTVYSVSKELGKKGFIVEDLAGQASTLVAIPPQELRFLIQKEEKELEQKKQSIGQMIEELQSFTKNTKYAIPKITFIQEEDLMDYLYKRSDEWHRSIMEYDGILWGFQDHTFAENYEKWIDWEWRVGGPKDLRLRLFSNQSGIEEKNKGKEYSDRRKIKYWKKEKTFTGTVWVHGDYLILVQTGQRPHYLVEIYDKLLAENMREFFAGVWDEFEKKK